MADSNRTPPADLSAAGSPSSTSARSARLRKLQANPYRYSFFSAIRQVDCAFKEGPRTGNADRPSQEALRIGQIPSLKFAPASLSGFQLQHGKWQLQTYFFGLFGPNGPLPIHITEHAHQRILHHRDYTLAKFVDMFHHRMATFFYRAWAECQPTVQMDRPDSDRFAMYIGALCGIGMKSLTHRDAMPDEAKLFYSGHLSALSRHSSGLQAILESFFDVPVEIIPFVQHWVQLPKDCQWHLGKSPDAGTLGQNVTLGQRVSDCQQRFAIAMGPMRFDTFERLLPEGESLRRLTAIIANYVGVEFSWVVKLVLKKEQVPRLRLGRQGRLGWTTWLCSRTPAKDADQLEINPERRG